MGQNLPSEERCPNHRFLICKRTSRYALDKSIAWAIPPKRLKNGGPSRMSCHNIQRLPQNGRF